MYASTVSYPSGQSNLFTSAATVSTMMPSTNWIENHEDLLPLEYSLLTVPIITLNGQTALETFKLAKGRVTIRLLFLLLLTLTRYLNADYIFLKTVFATAIMLLVISYDIACQWHKNLWERMQIFPPEEALSSSVRSVLFLVPKFHLPVHVEACNLQFSFNLTKGVGRMDGEAPERGWANINPAVQSMKEMGPGTRCDTLDDHFGDWNWKKTIKLGMSFICFFSSDLGTNPMFVKALR